MVMQHYRWDFIGLSTDEKPTPQTSEKVVDGSTFYCSDTSKLYVFCKDTWYERKPLGGGGGATYTAGDGIDITDDTISIDPNVVATLTDLDNRIIQGSGTPTTSTVGDVGTLYEDTSNGKLYICTDANDPYVWEELGAGGGTTASVVQSKGSSTTDVMSQDATTKMIYPNYTTFPDQIAIGSGSLISTSDGTAIQGSVSNSSYGIGIGTSSTYPATVSDSDHGIAIGYWAAVNQSDRSIAIGKDALVSSLDDSIAIGTNAQATRSGEVNVGAGGSTNGYNSTAYRLIGGVHDGLTDHDAATVGQLDGRVKLNAGTPTTSTVGTVGQLLEDTTNGKLYQCTATSGNTYTWTEVGAGGGGSVTVVQTTGSSTTDVMSQNAVTGMIYVDPTNIGAVNIRGVSGVDVSTGSSGIAIGGASLARGDSAVSIGNAARNYAAGEYSVTIGNSAKTDAHSRAVALGNAAEVGADNSVALGTNAKATRAGEVNVGADTSGRGYNATNYRVIGGVHDGQLAQDAVTVNQVNGVIDAINTALSTNIPHIGASS